MLREETAAGPPPSGPLRPHCGALDRDRQAPPAPRAPDQGVSPSLPLLIEAIDELGTLVPG